MSKLVLMLTRDEVEQLKRLANQNLRKPQDQARYILRCVLLGQDPQENNKPVAISVSQAEMANGFVSGQP